jgi:hypothetical protein
MRWRGTTSVLTRGSDRAHEGTMLGLKENRSGRNPTLAGGYLPVILSRNHAGAPPCKTQRHLHMAGVC